MKKTDAEPAIRQMMSQWRSEAPQRNKPVQDLNYSDFRSWTEANHYGHYFTFRSTMGAEYDAEMWFAREFQQSWKS